MNIIYRTPTEADWEAILQPAFDALPWDDKGNQEWVQKRQAFDGLRYHIVAENTENSIIVGYGSLEESPEKGMFRVYVGMSPERLLSGLGDSVYDHLSQKFTELNAQHLWAREYTKDTAIHAFFTSKGFIETERFKLDGYEEMFVMRKSLSD